MGHKICGLARGPDRPGNLPGGHGQRVVQDSCTTTTIFMLTALSPPRLSRLGGGFALQHLHASFFITADHQAALLVGRKRFDVQLTNGGGLGLKVLIVAVQPVFTLVRLEIDIVQDTPEAGAAEWGGGGSLEQSRRGLRPGPTGGGTVPNVAG